MRPADRPSQYRHPRTLEEAFGPGTPGLDTEARRGMAGMFAAAIVVLLTVAGAMAWLVTSTIWASMAP